jgi:hypothetical protein
MSGMTKNWQGVGNIIRRQTEPNLFYIQSPGQEMGAMLDVSHTHTHTHTHTLVLIPLSRQHQDDIKALFIKALVRRFSDR